MSATTPDLFGQTQGRLGSGRLLVARRISGGEHVQAAHWDRPGIEATTATIVEAWRRAGWSVAAVQGWADALLPGDALLPPEPAAPAPGIDAPQSFAGLRRAATLKTNAPAQVDGNALWGLLAAHDALEAAAGEARPPGWLADYLAWAVRTFGERPDGRGCAAHLVKEAAEARDDPLALDEWADCLLLTLQGAWRSGYSFEGLIDAAGRKFRQVLVHRQWGPPDEHGACQHLPAGRDAAP